MPLKATKPPTIDKVTEALLQKKWCHGNLPEHAKCLCCQMPMLPLCHPGNHRSTRFPGVMEEQPKSRDRFEGSPNMQWPHRHQFESFISPKDGPLEGGWIYLGQINVLKDIVCMGPSTHLIAKVLLFSWNQSILSLPSHMSDQQEQRVHFYHQVDIVPILPHQQVGPSLVPAGDNGSSHSDSRGLLERMKNVEVPTPPVSLVHVLAKPPSKAPEPNLFKRMKNVEVPTPPVSQVHALAKPPSKAPKPNLFKRMKDAEVPTPPMSQVHALAKPPSKAPEPNLFKRMRNAEVPTLPTALPASWRATIPQAPSPTEGDYVFIYPLYDIANLTTILGADSHQSGNVPQNANCGSSPGSLSAYRVNFGDPDQRQLGTSFSYALAGDLPTIDEHQFLQHAELAVADTNDDGSAAMKWLAVDILHLVTSQVKCLQVGQYTMDMLDLLEVLQYPHVEYDVEPYTGVCDWPKEWFSNVCLDLATTEGTGLPHPSNGIVGKPYSNTPNMFHAYLWCQEDQRRFQDEIQQIPLTTFHMINQIGQQKCQISTILTEFQEMRGSKIFCIAYDYFQVHTYMHSLREIKGEVEWNNRDIDHLFLQWSALS
ncbi:hypothetical protein EDC04DRAFT_2613661 [Pisolithus marmoratus]|nr:hypothetical protein EDC04DRAFT_2613661 [Pisolithus marmoratus]